MSSANVNYGGRPGMTNCTVRHPDQDKALAAQKEASAAGIRENAKHSKKKNGKGTRTLTHVITEAVHKDGLEERVKVKIATKRTNR